jgi:hypothetical protein
MLLYKTVDFKSWRQTVSSLNLAESHLSRLSHRKPVKETPRIVVIEVHDECQNC